MLRRPKHSEIEVVVPEEEVYRVSFSWVKRQGYGVNHSLTPSVDVNENPTRCNSMQIFIYCKVTLHVSGVTAPIIRPDQATLEGSSCTSIMTCTGGYGYSF